MQPPIMIDTGRGEPFGLAGSEDTRPRLGPPIRRSETPARVDLSPPTTRERFDHATKKASFLIPKFLTLTYTREAIRRRGFSGSGFEGVGLLADFLGEMVFIGGSLYLIRRLTKKS